MGDEPGTVKPTYDGRQGYHKIMEDLMRQEMTTILVPNVPVRYRIIKAMFAMVRPYMKESAAEKNKAVLVEIGNRLGSVLSPQFRATNLAHCDADLDELKEKMFLDGKYFFLPSGEEGSDEVDWEAAMREGRL